MVAATFFVEIGHRPTETGVRNTQSIIVRHTNGCLPYLPRSLRGLVIQMERVVVIPWLGFSCACAAPILMDIEMRGRRSRLGVGVITRNLVVGGLVSALLIGRQVRIEIYWL